MQNLDDYSFPIRKWMIDKLNLKGNELILFAFMYNELETSKECLLISYNEMVDFFKLTKPTILSILKNLEKKNLIIKENIFIDEVLRNVYSINFDYLCEKFDFLERKRFY